MYDNNVTELSKVVTSASRRYLAKRRYFFKRHSHDVDKMAAEQNEAKTEVNNVKFANQNSINRIRVIAPYAYVEVQYSLQYTLTVSILFLHAFYFFGEHMLRSIDWKLF